MCNAHEPTHYFNLHIVHETNIQFLLYIMFYRSSNTYLKWHKRTFFKYKRNIRTVTCQWTFHKFLRNISLPPLKALGKALFHVSLLTSVGLLQPGGGEGGVICEANSFLGMMFSLCPCLCPDFPFYKALSHIGLEIHPTPVWPHLN